MNILFVCTGNICRSPMCGAYFARLSERAGTADSMTCSTAGTCAGDGAPASVNAAAVMKENGLDLSAHRSSCVTKDKVSAADIIIALSQSHRRSLTAMFPESAPKTHVLTEFSDGNADGVPDPFGGGIEEYRKCFAAMRPALDNLFLDLRSKYKI